MRAELKNPLKTGRGQIKSLVFLLVISSLMLMQCHKDKVSPAQVIPECVVTSIKAGETVLNSFEYNTEKKLTKYTFIMNGGNQSRTFEYKTDSIIEKYFDVDGTLLLVSRYLVDGNGVASKSFATNYIGTVATNTNSTYSYNSDGYLTKIVDTYVPNNTSYTKNLTYADGNLVSIISADNPSTDIQSFEYYSDIINNNNVNYARGSFYHTMFGKKSKNLAKKISVTDGNNGSISEYTYELDAKGNISKVTNSYTKIENGVSSGPTSRTSDFTYECK